MPPRVYQWVEDSVFDYLRLRVRVRNAENCEVLLERQLDDGTWQKEDSAQALSADDVVELDAYIGEQPVTVKPGESGDITVDAGASVDVTPDTCTAYKAVGDVILNVDGKQYFDGTRAWVACDSFTIVNNSDKPVKVSWWRVPEDKVMRTTMVRISVCGDVMFEGSVEDARPFVLATEAGAPICSEELTAQPAQEVKVDVTVPCTGALSVVRVDTGDEVYVDTIDEPGTVSFTITAPEAVGSYTYRVDTDCGSCQFTLVVKEEPAQCEGGGAAAAAQVVVAIGIYGDNLAACNNPK